MEANPLYDPGFLGGTFIWWIGQIADESTWRDNINPGKHTDHDSSWGYRYKVRIIGIHDQGESVIPSTELPWAQVMYPITAGGGQAGSHQTPNIRQGNMVFGFFMDGVDQQIPVIMGVLGHNKQSKLNKKIGIAREDNTDDDPDNRSLDTSGYAEGDPLNRIANNDPRFNRRPDSDKIVRDDVDNDTDETPGGHRISAADIILEDKLSEKIPLSKPDPEESVDSAMKSMQIISEEVSKKIDTLLSSLSGSPSAGFILPFSAVDTDIDATAEKIKGVIDSLTKESSINMSKHMKVLMDKTKEFAIASLNDSLTSVVSNLPSTERWKFSDIKKQSTLMLSEEFGKISNNLEGMIVNIFDNMFPMDLVRPIVETIMNNNNDEEEVRNVPRFEMCTMEVIVAKVYNEIERGQIIEVGDGYELDPNPDPKLPNLPNITSGIFDSIDNFLGDTGSLINGTTNTTGIPGDAIGALTGPIDEVMGKFPETPDVFGKVTDAFGNVKDLANLVPEVPKVPKIKLDLASALLFNSIKGTREKYELPSKTALSDFYQLTKGSGAIASSTAIGLANVVNIKNNLKEKNKSIENTEKTIIDQSIISLSSIPFKVPFNKMDQNFRKVRDIYSGEDIV